MLSRSIRQMGVRTRGFHTSRPFLQELADVSEGSDFPRHVMNAAATEVDTLSNGMRVASEGAAASETATVGVWIDAGSRYETEANNGTAHFLEHLSFKGTTKRTREQLEKEVENIGGHLNAYTSREQTVYYMKVLKKDVEQATDILSDILTNSVLDPKAIEYERGVILREMEEVNKIDEELLFDNLHETAFQGTGLGRTILGPRENILSIQREHLESYVKTHYTAPRMVFVGAGGVEQQQMCDLADKYFGSVPGSPAAGHVVPTDTTAFTGSDIRVRRDGDDLAHIALAFEVGGWTDEHAFTLMVMQTLLGEWDRTGGNGKHNASFLARAVASEELAHRVSAFNTSYKDIGLFGVYAIAEQNRLNDLMYYTMESLVRFVHKTSESEVIRAREQLKCALLKNLDGGSNIAEEIGRQMLTYGRRLTPAEIYQRIDAVDAEAVRACADKYINDQEIAMSALGPIYELPDYNWLRRRTYWVRYG